RISVSGAPCRTSSASAAASSSSCSRCARGSRPRSHACRARLAPLAGAVPQSALAWVGAAYLLYLGWQMLGHGDAQAEARKAHHPVRFLQAALFQFLNPKAWVMTVTAATLFLPRELGPLLSGAYMAAVMEGIGVPCMSV